MKEKLYKIICAAFLGILAAAMIVPLAGMIFYDAGEAARAEQRTLEPFPEFRLTYADKKTFGEHFEAWFADHFAFRAEMVDADAAVMLDVFDSSPEDDVIAGKDGWLFYAETAKDFLGERFSEEDVEKLVEFIKNEQKTAAECGAGYVFAVAPNKNSIYPEMMAERYGSPCEESLLDRLTARLKEEGVTVCDLKETLISAKNRGILYYSGDSHWNLLGSTVALEALADAVEKEVSVRPSGTSRTPETLSAGAREDDLLKMVRPLNAIREEAFSQDSSPDLYTAAQRIRSLDDTKIVTAGKEPSGLTLIMSRDSFGRALIKPLSESFAHSIFVRGNTFDIEALAAEAKKAAVDEPSPGTGTVVIREIVERNLLTLVAEPQEPAKDGE
ncbi:MAG: hypothetical protein J6T65_08485 [Clostridia bacterium]|nr:hypothetical protein [Clostridia bacterium]